MRKLRWLKKVIRVWYPRKGLKEDTLYVARKHKKQKTLKLKRYYKRYYKKLGVSKYAG